MVCLPCLWNKNQILSSLDEALADFKTAWEKAEPGEKFATQNFNP